MATKRQVTTHVRRANGTGRVQMASIMVPKSMVDEFNCWKAAYSERFGIPMTNESVLRWWMDHVGQTDRVNGKAVLNWDSDVAKLTKRKYREFLAAQKAAEAATEADE